MGEVQHKVYQKTVQDLVHLYENDQLELSPPFQRESVWTDRDRAKLIDSILRGWPVPAIFLYRQQSEGEILYHVLDGKQRIESILRFMGAIRGGRFGTRIHLPGEDGPEWIDWAALKRQSKQHRITGYSISTIEVDGDFGEIVSLFVRINSTGKALTAAEKRNARFHKSLFLREATRLARSWEGYLRDCSICRKPVTWADLTIDHVKPFSKGGRTQLNNAALAHRSCNASKGARRRGE